MSEKKPILIPRDTVNDDVVMIAAWRARDGDAVRKGVALVDIETSKAILTVEAEADGFLEIVHRDGASVPVGAEIGYLRSSAEPSKAVASGPVGTAVASVDATPGPAASDPRFSRKARLLVESRGLDVALFAHLPVVRESDVLELLSKEKPLVPAPVSVAEAARESDIVATVRPPVRKSRGFFADAQTSANARGWSMFYLAYNYVVRNYLLNLLVHVAPVGVITGSTKPTVAF